MSRHLITEVLYFTLAFTTHFKIIKDKIIKDTRLDKLIHTP